MQPQKTSTAVATIDQARAFLNSKEVQSQLEHMADKHIKPDYMCRLVLTAVQKNSRLIECFASPAGKRSIGLAMLTAGQSGLPIDGKLSYIVPFRNKAGFTEAVWMASYMGLVQLSYNHSKVSAIWADEVHENDHFIYRKGINVVLEHTPTMRGDPGPLIASYAICKLTSGDVVPVVLFERDIDRIRSSSRGADQADSPWKTAPGQMWIKSAVRQLSKMIPQSKELQEVLSKEDEFEETGRVSNSVTIDVSPAVEPRFRKTSKPSPEQVDNPEAETTAGAVGDGVVEVQSESQPVTETSEPTPEKPTGKTGKPVEKDEREKLAESVAEFYTKEAGAPFDQVMTTMKRINKKWADNVIVSTFSLMPLEQLQFLFKGRYGIVSEVKRDVNAVNQ